MPKVKPYSDFVEEDVARQLLNSTGHSVEIGGDELFLGDALLAVAKQLEELVLEANRQLEGSTFGKIVAEHLAMDISRRGPAEIAVAENGAVMLHINYKGNPRTPRVPRGSSRRKSRLPLLKELKVRAKQLGVSIPSELGIKRSKILEYLDQAESGKVKDTKVKRKKPTAKIQTADDVGEVDPGPMSAGPDETKVSTPLDDTKPPAKPRGFVKTAEAVGPVVVSTGIPSNGAPSSSEAKPAKSGSSGGSGGSSKNMRQLVKDSKEVDVADLLGSEPPK